MSTIAQALVPDLTEPASFQDAVPFGAFDHMRSRPGVYWQDASIGVAKGGFWAITRFQDIIDIEARPDLFGSVPGAAWPGTNLPVDPQLNPTADLLMHTDPPRHSSVVETLDHTGMSKRGFSLGLDGEPQRGWSVVINQS
ncbi:hypothetical protein ACIHDR_38575 [Nocardia sp. NPDC052278]|uniref:hypothetical protein n=1 Tax=unclassified Nocardia TaxID=2637762 RepID=UPI003697CD2A